MENEETHKKFVIGGIVVLTLVIIGLVYYYSTNLLLTEEQKAEQEVLDYYADLEEQYRNDTYGGKTPEETLALFISALEVEDIELASKYFLPDEQEEISILLKEEFSVNNSFEYMISGLKKFERTTGKHDPNKEAFFIITDDDNLVINQAVLVKNQNGVWKITDL